MVYPFHFKGKEAQAYFDLLMTHYSIKNVMLRGAWVAP